MSRFNVAVIAPKKSSGLSTKTMSLSVESTKIQEPGSGLVHQPMNNDNEARACLLFPDRPQLERALAIYDYHSEDGTGFQFDIGDQISVRDYCSQDYVQRRWLGVNLKTCTSGFFPPSYVRSLTREPQALCPPAEPEEACTKRLLTSFHQQYGDDVDPKNAFKTINCLSTVEARDFWLVFNTAFPEVSKSSVELHNILRELHGALFYSDIYFNLGKCFLNQRWHFSQYVFRPSYLGQWQGWEDVRPLFQDAIPRAVKAWEELRQEFEKIKEPIPYLVEIKDNLHDLIPLLASQLDCMDSEVSTALKTDAQRVREYEKNLRTCEAEVKIGIFKTDSMSSGVDIEKTARNMKHRWLRKPGFKNSKHRSYSSSSDGIPLHWQIEYRWGDIKHQTRKTVKQGLKKLGETPAVLMIVVTLSVASAVTTGLATWKCSPPSEIPTIDSNFWSTFASAAIGIASLYCTIIPILLEQQIRVQNERLFHGLLWFSFVTAVAAVAVYPYQTQASMVLLFASGAAQLTTTLQIILGAVTKIQQDVVLIEEQMDEIADLRRRVR